MHIPKLQGTSIDIPHWLWYIPHKSPVYAQQSLPVLF